MKKTLLLILTIIIFQATSAFAAVKTYVLYNTSTPFSGYIISSGRMDPNSAPDGSTAKEWVLAVIAADPNLAYKLYGRIPLPDPETTKYDAATQTLVPLDPGDITPKVAKQQKHSGATAQLTLNDLSGKSYAEVENYIDNSPIVDPAVKAVLKKMAKIILAMLKRSDWSD